jgi:hypothetical protein
VVHAHELIGARGEVVQWRRRGKTEMVRTREGERGRPGPHIERARDVESQARHAHHAVADLCVRSAMTLTVVI